MAAGSLTATQRYATLKRAHDKLATHMTTVMADFRCVKGRYSMALGKVDAVMRQCRQMLGIAALTRAKVTELRTALLSSPGAQGPRLGTAPGLGVVSVAVAAQAPAPPAPWAIELQVRAAIPCLASARVPPSAWSVMSSALAFVLDCGERTGN